MKKLEIRRSVELDRWPRVAAIMAFAAFCGCSSADKKVDGSAAPAGGNAAAQAFSAGTVDGEEGAVPAAAVAVEPQKNISLDKKYQALGKALRGGGAIEGPGSVQDEATKLLGANPNDPIALNALAIVHLRRGHTGAAKLLLQRAIEKNAQGAELAGLRNNLGVCLIEEGDYEAAMVEFKKAVQADSHHPEAAGNLGSMFLKAGDVAKAKLLLETSYSANRGNAAVANNYAVCLRASGDLDGAKRIYEELIKTNSRDVSALLNYAILLIDFMGKPKEGLDIVYKVRFIETERKDVLSRANALEMKAKSELK